MEAIPEQCGNCGAKVYEFSSKEAASDNSIYCIKCAEELDMQYLAKNVCSVCTRLMEHNEVKLVMPSRLYSNYFFDKLPIETRLMCTACYRKAESLDLVRKPLVKINQIRLKLKRTFAKRILQRNVLKVRN
ncbi:MAG: hypothetical protein ABR981_02150 [Candidatus Micrarchaeaceae archaeon]|jgi:hypothetical protein